MQSWRWRFSFSFQIIGTEIHPQLDPNRQMIGHLIGPPLAVGLGILVRQVRSQIVVAIHLVEKWKHADLRDVHLALNVRSQKGHLIERFVEIGVRVLPFQSRRNLDICLLDRFECGIVGAEDIEVT